MTSNSPEEGFRGQRLTLSPAFVRWRHLMDRLVTAGVTLGGVSVIFAVLLIFFYLAWVVFPLFRPATLEVLQTYDRPGSGSPTLLLTIEEQAEVGTRVAADGSISFFELASGAVTAQAKLPWAPASLVEIDREHGTVAAMAESGELLVFRHRHRISYPGQGRRTITSTIEYPYGETPLELGLGAQPVLSVRADEERITVAAADASGIALRQLELSTSFLSDSPELSQRHSLHIDVPFAVDLLLMDPLQEWLFAISKASGRMAYYDLRALPAVPLVELLDMGAGEPLSDVLLLAGGISLLSAGFDGQLVQWFPLRDARGQYRLQRVREFPAAGTAPITGLSAEFRRRGFLAIDAGGQASIYYATSERLVLRAQVATEKLLHAVFSPRADRILFEGESGQMRFFALHNEHPEVSWKALWDKVWYESYTEPALVWQSSSASGDFEPKLSLSPLSFGTLKAAFYAMLFAVPLAIGGAIFTAYFMSPQLRQSVKPTIEVMEALPTVILGFLAGLWLAPYVEANLPGVFLLLLLLPLSMPLSGWLWTRIPERWRGRVPDGWQPLLLLPPLVLAAVLALGLSRPLELALFDGSLPYWLDAHGISFDQRNSLVVGLAMGFAVIPTIFSIAEDAIFGVPAQLSRGSLALGATRWQTLVRVVLPTASPGIFSALMIGLGRAVGETMIVLMATGNTPIMNFNIFEGFRTLSANIAVEMPEAEVASTHFRVLFLAGMVLFLFTFMVNTVAEIVRQRLRMKYSNL